MRRILALCIVIALSWSGAKAQEGGTVPYNKEKQAIIYTEVVETPGMTKDLLFDRAMLTLNEIYEQAEKKMSVKDKAKGEISMRCTTRVMLPDKSGTLYADKEFIQYKLDIAFKDGKYKYDFYDFHMDRGYHYPLEKFYLNDQTVSKSDRAEEKLAYVNQDIRDIIAKLKKGILDDRTKKKDDW